MKAVLSFLNDVIESRSIQARRERLAALDMFQGRFPDVLLSGEPDGLYFVQYLRFGIKCCEIYRSRMGCLNAFKRIAAESGVDELHWSRFASDRSRPETPYLYSSTDLQTDKFSHYQGLDKDLSNAVLAVDWFCKTYGVEESRIKPEAALDARVYHLMRSRGVFDDTSRRSQDGAHPTAGSDWLWQAWELSQILLELGLPPKIESWHFTERSVNPYKQDPPDSAHPKDEVWRFDKTLELLMKLTKLPGSAQDYTVGDFDIRLIGSFRQFMSSREARERFLDEMYRLGGHAVYSPEVVSDILNGCDIACRTTEWSVIVFDTIEIRITEPEWGKPGIYATDLVSAVIEQYRYNIESKMAGRGFRHRDLLSKLAQTWGIKRDFV